MTLSRIQHRYHCRYRVKLIQGTFARSRGLFVNLRDRMPRDLSMQQFKMRVGTKYHRSKTEDIKYVQNKPVTPDVSFRRVAEGQRGKEVVDVEDENNHV